MPRRGASGMDANDTRKEGTPAVDITKIVLHLVLPHRSPPCFSAVFLPSPSPFVSPAFFVLASSNAFCRWRLFQFSVREMLSTQSSLLRSKGSTLGKGKREAEMVT